MKKAVTAATAGDRLELRGRCAGPIAIDKGLTARVDHNNALSGGGIFFDLGGATLTLADGASIDNNAASSMSRRSSICRVSGVCPGTGGFEGLTYIFHNE